MPQTKSAKKAQRQTKKRTEYNKKVKEVTKKLIKDTQKAMKSDSKNIEEKVRAVQKALGKAVKAKIYHKNTAARKLSHLIKKIRKAKPQSIKKRKEETPD